jgi:Na+/H+ antiporter NhaD/arsenite permease-like protein
MTALVIFAAAYLVLALGRFPGLRVDRTGAAIIGAGFVIGLDVLTFEEAMRAVDHATLVLLFGMMIVVANLRLSGFFRLAGAWVVRHAHRPLTLLAAIVAVSGVFSAFFVNDTMCLVLTPLVLEIAGALGRNPVPYLLAVAMASNAGSAATITGNPQNMMIGSLSRIPYRQFTLALAPAAAGALVIAFAVIALVYRREFRDSRPVQVERVRVRVNRVLMAKSLAASAAMLALFFWGWPVARVALFAGGFLLITRRVKPEKVYHEIDWALLAMFAGLFIIVAGLEKVWDAELLAVASRFRLDRPAVLTAVSAALSNLVSNVPAVLLFRPLVPRLPDSGRAWLTLAMSSTFAGNLTLLGSVANLIVVERARREVEITFWDYFRAGSVVTVLSLAWGVLWLAYYVR